MLKTKANFNQNKRKFERENKNKNITQGQIYEEEVGGEEGERKRLRVKFDKIQASKFPLDTNYI